MLSAELTAQLKAHFEKLVQPIELVASLDETPTAKELRAMLEDLAALSDKVTLRGNGEDPRRPSFSIGRVGEAPRVRFAGLPTGHEFTSLVLALLQVSGHPPRVAPEAAARIRSLEGNLRFETFVSLSCHNCPEVVQALNTLAALHPGIEAVMVDGAVFQAEAEARQVMGVPAVFLNGQPFGQGRASLEEILSRLDPESLAQSREQLASKPAYDLLVVGGGPAGAAAAIYAARKGLRTGLVAERFGGQVLDTLGIENFISVKETEGPKLARALEQHVRQYEVDILDLQRAEGLVPAAEDGLVGVRLAGGAMLRSRTVVLATGARWREMGVPGEQEYRTRGVAYCPHCDGPLFKGKRVAVIGGGNSGVEAAIDLAGVAAHVTLLEFDRELRADAVLQRKLASLPNATVILSAQSLEVLGDGRKAGGLRYRDRSSGLEQHLELEGIFVQIGLVPNTDWLKGAVDLSARGEIEVDARGGTSLPGVFAAGDATTVPFKQIIIAMGEGAKASLGAFEHLIRTPLPAEAAALQSR